MKFWVKAKSVDRQLRHSQQRRKLRTRPWTPRHISAQRLGFSLKQVATPVHLKIIRKTEPCDGKNSRKGFCRIEVVASVKLLLDNTSHVVCGFRDDIISADMRAWAFCTYSVPMTQGYSCRVEPASFEANDQPHLSHLPQDQLPRRETYRPQFSQSLIEPFNAKPRTSFATELSSIMIRVLDRELTPKPLNPRLCPAHHHWPRRPRNAGRTRGHCHIRTFPCRY